MKKNILVLEDNNSAREMLVKCISEMECNIEIYQASNFMEACSVCMMFTIDVFLVDIILDATDRGDVSGLTFVEKIREMDKYRFTPVIFITSLEDPKLYTYTNIHSFAYVEKPYSPTHIRKVVQEALYYTTARSKESNLYFRKDGIIYSVSSSEIVYMEIINHKLYIQTIRERMSMSYKTCRRIMKEVGNERFMQCSRSTIVNKAFIKGFDMGNRYLILKDGYGTVEVGSTYAKIIKMQFQNKYVEEPVFSE